MSGLLENRTFVITGSRGDLGRTLVDAFVAEGANGAGLDASYARSQKMSHNDAVKHLRCDVSVETEVEAAFSSVISEFGVPDILVNCAGIMRRTSWDQTSTAEWDEVMGVNLRGVFLPTQRAAKAMIDATALGHIVNVASLAARTGGQAASVTYTTSKTAIIGLTRSMAVYLAPKGILVNCVAPGPIEGEMISDWTPEVRQLFLRETPLGKISTPNAVAQLIMFLVSERNSMITGQTIDINGGRYLS